MSESEASSAPSTGGESTASESGSTAVETSTPVSAPAKRRDDKPMFPESTNTTGDVPKFKASDYDIVDPDDAPIPSGEADDEAHQEAHEEKSEIDSALAKKIQDLGISDHVKDLKPEAQKALIEAVERKLASQPAPVKQEEKAEVKELEPEPVPEFKLELGVDVDPEISKAFDGLHKHYQSKDKQYQSKITQLESAIGHILGQEKQRTQAQYEDQFETSLQSLGEDFHELLGKGRAAEIGNNSEAMQNRVKIYREVAALSAGYQQTGQTVPSLGELVKRATHALFSDNINEFARKRIDKSLEKREKQFTVRPTHRDTKDSLTDREKAIAKIKSMMKDKGIAEDEE